MSELMFSVCVITYNQEKFIAQTLDSILLQEHNYSYEIVIGDDCSQDNTREIIAEYASKYSEIIKPIYNEKNLGLIGNYFNTINHCTGKYIMECAGDDWWLPGKGASQIKFMEAHEDVGMCYGLAKVWNENIQKYERQNFGTRRESFDELLIKGNGIPAPSVCFRRDVFQKYQNDISPEQRNWLLEDYPTWLYFAHESKIVFFSKELAVYRILKNSASHSTDVKKRIKFSKNVYELRKFFAEKYFVPINNLSDEYITFHVYIDLLNESYNKIYSQELRKIYKSLNEKSIKDKIYNFASYNFLLWKFLQYVISLWRMK